MDLYVRVLDEIQRHASPFGIAGEILHGNRGLVREIGLTHFAGNPVFETGECQHTGNQLLDALVIVEDSIEPALIFLRRPWAHSEQLNGGPNYGNSGFQFVRGIAYKSTFGFESCANARHHLRERLGKRAQLRRFKRRSRRRECEC